MFKKLSIPLFALLALQACSSQDVFNSYEPISDHIWQVDSAQSFEFEIADTTHYYDLSFLLRIDDSYRYSNLYIQYTMSGPSGGSRTKQKNITLADKSGKWLGSGYSNIFSYDVPLMQEIKFSAVGTYSVKLKQHMREESLHGVHDIGLKVTKGDEVF